MEKYTYRMELVFKTPTAGIRKLLSMSNDWGVIESEWDLWSKIMKPPNITSFKMELFQEDNLFMDNVRNPELLNNDHYSTETNPTS